MNILEDSPDIAAFRPADLRDIRLRKENSQIINAIQEIILAEEDRVMSRDEVLSRILGFYGRYVPFKEHMRQG
jgi:hypothetical protein